MKIKTFFLLLTLVLGCATTVGYWMKDRAPDLHFRGKGTVGGWPALFFTVSNPTHKTEEFMVLCWKGDHCHDEQNCQAEYVTVPPRSDKDVTMFLPPGIWTCRLAKELESDLKPALLTIVVD